MAAGIVAASFLDAKYSFDFDRYKKYFPILLVLLTLSVGSLRLFIGCCPRGSVKRRKTKRQTWIRCPRR